MSLEELSPAQARGVLLAAAQLHPFAGGDQVLEALGCIQIDPINRYGTSPDLVLHARLEGYTRGEWSEIHGFEHFAKERCLLPERLFPHYRDQAVETPWWRLTQRLKRLDPERIEQVYREVEERGPVTAKELGDHGQVRPLDWHGWKGTGKVGSMAMEVLWTRCRLVVNGRRGRQRIYDTAARALPQVHDAPGGDFARTVLLQRVRSAGLLSTADGPWWSMLGAVRKSDLPDRLVTDGVLVRARVTGSRRTYLTTPELLQARPNIDDRMRIIAPLDPLIWDRKLVEHAFDFAYTWEIYKKAQHREYGYYVSPLLLGDWLVGRFEGRRSENGVDTLGLWGDPPKQAWQDCLARLEAMQR